ncbi:MAG: hypothetical protein ACKVOR_04380, partial [Flavobacteriales bacterium]
MKKFLLFSTAILFFTGYTIGQNEVEPNDDFASANTINAGMIAYGNLYQNGPTDYYDYFTFTMPENGSVDIEFIVTNESGGTLSADFVLFYAN